MARTLSRARQLLMNELGVIWLATTIEENIAHVRSVGPALAWSALARSAFTCDVVGCASRKAFADRKSTMRMLANVLLRTHGKNYRVVDRSPR